MIFSYTSWLPAALLTFQMKISPYYLFANWIVYLNVNVETICDRSELGKIEDSIINHLSEYFILPSR